MAAEVLEGEPEGAVLGGAQRRGGRHDAEPAFRDVTERLPERVADHAHEEAPVEPLQRMYVCDLEQGS